MFVPSWFMFVPNMIISYHFWILSHSTRRNQFWLVSLVEFRCQSRLEISGRLGFVMSERLPVRSWTSFWKMKIWIWYSVVRFQTLQVKCFVGQRRIVMNINLNKLSCMKLEYKLVTARLLLPKLRTITIIRFEKYNLWSGILNTFELKWILSSHERPGIIL